MFRRRTLVFRIYLAPFICYTEARKASRPQSDYRGPCDVVVALIRPKVFNRFNCSTKRGGRRCEVAIEITFTGEVTLVPQSAFLCSSFRSEGVGGLKQLCVLSERTFVSYFFP
ncbi:hypothetical protein E2C01_006418 [Portunus trituberculatus]|uniref:Secreted protein n=1 Tax=Portunus trituberculatus TaxID=210409 RepID=A0A5B7CY55_PORTR|nr:hypothetical protein [Portunus trituberculatus]